MRPIIAMTKNIENLVTAYQAIKERPPGQPCMGLIYGPTGSGKTTAIAWARKQFDNGIYLRAEACWTAAVMLERILFEAKIKTDGRRSADWVRAIYQYMEASQRPLFLDEADYLLPDTRMIETLRDIHDMSGMPVLLIGMEGFESRVLARKQLARRIYRHVEFLPMDLEDARTLFDTLGEVKAHDDLVERAHREARGSIAHLTAAVAQIEGFCRRQGWAEIDLQRFGGRELFFSGSLNGSGPRRRSKGGQG